MRNTDKYIIRQTINTSEEIIVVENHNNNNNNYGRRITYFQKKRKPKITDQNQVQKSKTDKNRSKPIKTKIIV